MEFIFIVSAAVIFMMIALRMLEIRFERPIILAHLSWPIEKRLRVHFKKIPALIEGLDARVDRFKADLRTAIARKISELRAGGEEYVAGIQESLRGKRALTRGSVSFFLLNISDYGTERAEQAVPVPVEREAAPMETEATRHIA